MKTFTRISLYGATSAILALGVAPVASATNAAVDAHAAAITPPGAPTHVQVKPKRTKLKVSWQTPASGPAPTGYQVKIKGRSWKDAGGLRQTIKGLTPSTRYTVKVRSCINRIYSPPVTKQATTKG